MVTWFPGRHQPTGRIFDDLQGIGAPNSTVGRSDHSDGQVEFADFFEFLCQNGGKGVEDVGEVFHGFAVQETLVGFVVEQFFYGIVLAEGIHREEDVVAGHVRCHGIRPMEHTHFYENKLLPLPMSRLSPVLTTWKFQPRLPYWPSMLRTALAVQ